MNAVLVGEPAAVLLGTEQRGSIRGGRLIYKASGVRLFLPENDARNHFTQRAMNITFICPAATDSSAADTSPETVPGTGSGTDDGSSCSRVCPSAISSPSTTLVSSAIPADRLFVGPLSFDSSGLLKARVGG